MQPPKHTAYPSRFYGPLGGAVAAVGLAFAYALVFVVYAVIRSSLLLGSVASDAGFGGTIIAYAAALTLAALTIAALMALPVAVIGLITAAIVKRSGFWFNPRHSESRSIAVGTFMCFIIVLVFHVLLQRALGFSMSDVVSNSETYLLWLGFPSLIYIAAGGVASRKLFLLRKESVP